jgi:hypothetical protein
MQHGGCVRAHQLVVVQGDVGSWAGHTAAQPEQKEHAMTVSATRLERAHIALEGLSVGDAFGERFFVHPDLVGSLLDQRALPAPPWSYTDDTEMAEKIRKLKSES